MTTDQGGDVTSSILRGIDGSPDARLALRTAAQLSGQLGVRLVVAHIVQARVTSPAGSMTPPGTAGGERARASRSKVGAIGDGP